MKSTVIMLTGLLYIFCFPLAEARQNKTEQKKSILTKRPTSNKIIKATTEDGRKVFLKSDGRWEFAEASSRESKPLLPESAIKALAEFAKIAGSTELGVEYDEYKSILIGFKATVNQAMQDLPDDILIAVLRDALNNYEMALKQWDTKNLLEKYKFDGWSEKAIEAFNQRANLWRESRSQLEYANEVSKQYERR